MSVYCSPLTVEPPGKVILNGFPTSVDEELAEGSYKVCPLQVESQSGPGRNRSLLPVSKPTVTGLVLITVTRRCLKQSLAGKGHWGGSDCDGTIPEMGIVIDEFDTTALPS